MSKPHSFCLIVQICIVHTCGRSMAEEYTKELKLQTITVLENLWDIRFAYLSAE